MSAGDGRDGRRLVLAIEDEDDIARALSVLLVRIGLEVLLASDGREGLRLFHEHRPAMVILDVGLPEMDGWTTLERLRELSDVPVLMLTARDNENDKVRGLRSGADDYLTKPFGNAELVARVEALLRRAGTGRGAPEMSDSAAAGDRAGGGAAPLRIGPVSIDLHAHLVEVAGHEVELTPTEYRLLLAFVRHRGQVLSSEQLLRLVWQDPTATGPDRVKFAVGRLRRKLGWGEANSCPLETVRGFGYRMRAF